MNDQPPSLRPLTAFRFLAALAVFLHHMQHYCLADPRLAKAYRAVFVEGYAGVGFFFVLSGFILAYNYNRHFASLRGREIKKFYAARFARIYPVHAVTFLAVLPLSAGDLLSRPGSATLRAAANVMLIQSFIPRADFYFSYNAPSWSLSDELFFYALLPLLLWAVHSLHLTRPAWSAWLTVSFLTAALGLTWMWHQSPCFHWLCYIDPLFRVVDFAAGVALCFTYLGLREAHPRKPGRTSATLLELASLVPIGVMVVCAQAVPYGVRLGSYYTPAMALIIFVFAFQRGQLSALLSSRAWWLLGEMSFSFYMLHGIALRYLNSYGAKLHLERCGPRTSIGLIFSVTLVLSAVCYYGLERPLRERLKRWLIQGSGKPGGADSVGQGGPLRQAA